MTSLNTYDTVIIGGGISGIAAALRRKKQGDRVLLLEKNEKLGGKLDELRWEDYRWDKGPSLFTLPHLVDELFELFGKQSKDYFDYVLHSENCRYFYQDGTQFTFYSDSEKRKEELAVKFNQRELKQIEDYVSKTASTYNAIGNLFIDAPKLTIKDALKKEIIKQYPKIISRQMMLTLDGFNRRKLSNEKLVQLFNRFGTYNGSNPYKMSGLYSMIPHLELNLGTYFPKGGMRAIINGLVQLAKEEGVEIKTEQKNIRSFNIQDKYLSVANGEEYWSENLVCSIDHVTFYKKVFKDKKLLYKYLSEERSSSGLVFYWAINQKFEEIGLHNILFSSDYKREFSQIFDDVQIPDEPTIYIHNSSSIEENDAPKQGQNWFVMINTPAGIDPTSEQIEKTREFIISRIRQLVGIDIKSKILFEDKWTMGSIESITGSYQGALYGGAFNSKLASFKRHGNQSKKYKNLYFTGGSVHPGGGIPLVLKSAKIVDQLIQNNA